MANGGIMAPAWPASRTALVTTQPCILWVGHEDDHSPHLQQRQKMKGNVYIHSPVSLYSIYSNKFTSMFYKTNHSKMHNHSEMKRRKYLLMALLSDLH
jgi:hypothetical protein